MLPSHLVISVLVADDHRMFRQGLLRLFSEDARFRLVPDAPNGPEALRRIITSRPGVAVLSASLSGLDGLQIAARVTALGLPTRCIILAVRGDRLSSEQVFRTGAAGCLLKDAGFEDLAGLACRAADGEDRLGSLDGPELRAAPPGHGLSRREMEVLRLVARGFTSKQVAEALFISPYTVDCHRQRIMRKLSIANGPGLVRFALENGIQ